MPTVSPFTYVNTVFRIDFSSRSAVTALCTLSLFPEDKSNGQNLGFDLGCFLRCLRNAHVRQVFASFGAVGDCESHLGYF